MSKATVDPFKEVGSGACFVPEKTTDISSLTSALEELQRGPTNQDELGLGLRTDSAWRSEKNNPLKYIKTETQLKAALKHAYALKTPTLKSAFRNFEAIFTAAGWPATYTKL